MRIPNGFSSVWRVFPKASVSFCAIFGALCKDFNISGGAAKLPLIFFCFLLASCTTLTIDSTHTDAKGPLVTTRAVTRTYVHSRANGGWLRGWRLGLTSLSTTARASRIP